jgi:hypothetical protein
VTTRDMHALRRRMAVLALRMSERDGWPRSSQWHYLKAESKALRHVFQDLVPEERYPHLYPLPERYPHLYPLPAYHTCRPPLVALEPRS